MSQENNTRVSVFDRLHARLGDFWWYSLLIFVASRAADCLNAFVGLWLVPKYVGPGELGAVQPLMSFATIFALPAMVFASTFRNELSNLAQEHAFGRMKTLMRSVFIAAALFFFLSIIISRWVLPVYLIRLRIAEGSLGVVVLASSFIGAISPVYTNALQSLKKLRTLTLVNLLGAPVRLLAMIVTMPLRALTGYFVGQCAAPGFSIVASVVGLRKELAVKAEPYWNGDNARRFLKLFFIFGASTALGLLPSLVESTVIRQRLPEIDSAAYYMITRFSEIAGFFSATLVLTIFPFSAELAAKGKSYAGLVKKSCVAIFLSNVALAVFFALFGRLILSCLPNGGQYANYWWGIPWLIGINALNIFPSIYSTAEVSANHYRVMFVTAPINIISPLLLLCITGFGYFKGVIPDAWYQYLQAHNITTLVSILAWITVWNFLRLASVVIYARFNRAYGAGRKAPISA